MKRISTLFLLSLITILVKGQQTKHDFSNDVKISKTANKWDAFGNFIQLIGNDITGDNKGVQFKGVLFPLFSLDTVKRNSSNYYIKHTWMRNSELQFGIVPGKHRWVTKGPRKNN